MRFGSKRVFQRECRSQGGSQTVSHEGKRQVPAEYERPVHVPLEASDRVRESGRGLSLDEAKRIDTGERGMRLRCELQFVQLVDATNQHLA